MNVSKLFPESLLFGFCVFISSVDFFLSHHCARFLWLLKMFLMTNNNAKQIQFKKRKKMLHNGTISEAIISIIFFFYFLSVSFLWIAWHLNSSHEYIMWCTMTIYCFSIAIPVYRRAWYPMKIQILLNIHLCVSSNGHGWQAIRNFWRWHKHETLTPFSVNNLFSYYVICLKMKQIINGYLWYACIVYMFACECYLAVKCQEQKLCVCVCVYKHLPFRSHEC